MSKRNRYGPGRKGKEDPDTDEERERKAAKLHSWSANATTVKLVSGAVVPSPSLPSRVTGLSSPSDDGCDAPATPTPHVGNTIRIVSWNVENLEPYIASSETRAAGQGTRPISSYFKSTSNVTAADAHSASIFTPRSKQTPSLRRVLEHFGFPDLLCLQETRVRPQDASLIAAAETAANAPDAAREERRTSDDDGGGGDGASARPGYKCFMSLCSDTVNVKFRGGRMYGVATYVKVRRGLEVRAVREVDWDKEGRVLILEFEKFTVVNVYAVNGTGKPYFDPVTGHQLGSRHERKRVFNRLLVDELGKRRKGGAGVPPATADPVAVTEAHRTVSLPALNCVGGRASVPSVGDEDVNRACVASGATDLSKPVIPDADRERYKYVVVIGDFNISRASMDCHPRLRTEHPHDLARKEFNEQFLTALDLVDSFRHLHPSAKKYSWFLKGVPQGRDCARVDLGLVTRNLITDGLLLGADILQDPADRFRSDHAPITLTLREFTDQA